MTNGRRLEVAFTPRPCRRFSKAFSGPVLERSEWSHACCPGPVAACREGSCTDDSFLAGPLLRTKAHGIPVLPAAGAAVLKLLDTPQRRYNREKNTVAKEYDAWTEDGVLEHYWGEHIHLGWYSPQEMRDGYKKKVGCPAFWTVAQ